MSISVAVAYNNTALTTSTSTTTASFSRISGNGYVAMVTLVGDVTISGFSASGITWTQVHRGVYTPGGTTTTVYTFSGVASSTVSGGIAFNTNVTGNKSILVEEVTDTGGTTTFYNTVTGPTPLSMDVGHTGEYIISLATTSGSLTPTGWISVSNVLANGIRRQTWYNNTGSSTFSVSGSTNVMIAFSLINDAPIVGGSWRVMVIGV